MRVLGFNFTKIHASRKDKWEKNEKINTNIELSDIEKDSIDILKQNEIIKVKFSYKILYEPNNAEVIFEGNIILDLDETLSKEMIKDWKKKEIPEKIKIPLLNLVMTKCNIKALELEEQLSMPFHLKLPRATGIAQQSS
ncbi:MAG: hypothetical protein AABW79_02105 [Nanoarchaeota archaeon]